MDTTQISDSGKGRHMVATEAIAAGEVILSERPFGSVLVASGGTFGTERRHCHACLKPAWRLVPCAGCSYARYCAARCRDGAWEEHHRWECPLGACLAAAGVLSHLALRVALKAGVANIRGAAYQGVWGLLHHVERHAASIQSRFFASGLSDAHVQSVEERRVATAVFPTLSLINHSCRPNTSLSFGAGGAVTLRAAQSLRSGQEVAHCYGQTTRRRLLQEQYFFLCRCEACQEDWSPDEQSGLLCARCDASLLVRDFLFGRRPVLALGNLDQSPS
uniref:Protein-lysine N-methyltransferase SMYD4 n=1 Tax=Hippocampus comes TaxID=109280 RepID=A0A3Q2YX53_HIPCM